MSRRACELCGLPSRYGKISQTIGNREVHFCCQGCRMVYAMLVESARTSDPERFKRSALYRNLVAAGVIPADEADLRRLHAPDTSTRPTSALVQGVNESAGTPETLPLTLRVEGMWCPACAWVIEAALSKMKGVSDIHCHFSSDRLLCRYRPERITPDMIRQALGRLGYRVRDTSCDSAGRETTAREWIRLFITALLSSNVMMLSWALYTGFFTDLPEDAVWKISLPIVIMTTVVVIYGGGPMWRKAWFGLIHRRPGMETLVGMAAGSAFFYSLHNWLAGSIHLYFDTACMLIALVLLAKVLEHRAKSRMLCDLENFFVLRPSKVRMITQGSPGGRYVATKELSAGNRFVVEAGEIVAADGRVVSGTALLDESSLTGEPRPVAVKSGDPVKAGTRVMEGRVTATAEKLGEETVLGQMIAVMTKSLEETPAYEGRTDRLLRWFVPMIFALAAAAGVLSAFGGLRLDQSIIRAVTVLVISCPCALGVAIPMTRLAGISLAGRRGILVREIDAFERAREVDRIVFDKTGTLTVGRWWPIRVECLPGYGELDVIAWAAGLEKHSDHEIARAITALAREKGVPPADVRDVRTMDEGVCGHLEGKVLRFGKCAYDYGGEFTDSSPHKQGWTKAISTVCLDVNGRPAAVFGFGDTIRPGAPSLVGLLKKEFPSMALISGDGNSATREVARSVGLPVARGGLPPAGKAKFIDAMSKNGHRVAMVGDGVNDAAAMARAHLSAAVYTGQPLVAETAHITLMRGDPAQLLDFFSLSRRVNRKIVQNLWCAWAYNLIGIPVAMMGLLTPLLAATAMVLSSLTVIGNTLLLLRGQ